MMGGVFTLIIHKNTRRSLDRFHDADYLRQRTVEGMETARLNGKQIGGAPGKKLHVKKAEEAKELIKQLSKDFDGTLTDVVMIEKKLAGVSRNSFYKYKRELKAEMNTEIFLKNVSITLSITKEDKIRLQVHANRNGVTAANVIHHLIQTLPEE